MTDEAQAQRRGVLKNGNQSGDLEAVVRCGARTRAGSACQQPAMHNGRCRLHGGKSTGPRTPEGLERSRRANWKLGRYSAEAMAELREMRRVLRALRALIAE